MRQDKKAIKEMETNSSKDCRRTLINQQGIEHKFYTGIKRLISLFAEVSLLDNSQGMKLLHQRISRSCPMERLILHLCCLYVCSLGQLILYF